jgi:hypothetical protein
LSEGDLVALRQERSPNSHWAAAPEALSRFVEPVLSLTEITNKRVKDDSIQQHQGILSCQGVVLKSKLHLKRNQELGCLLPLCLTRISKIRERRTTRKVKTGA